MQLTLLAPYGPVDGVPHYRTADITISENKLEIVTEDGLGFPSPGGSPRHTFVRTAPGDGIGGGLAGSWRSVEHPEYAATLNAGQWMVQTRRCLVTGTMSSTAISGGGPCNWTMLATRCEGAGCPMPPRRLGEACVSAEKRTVECSSGYCVKGRCSVWCGEHRRECPAGYGCDLAEEVCVKGAPPLSDGGLDALTDSSMSEPRDATHSKEGPVYVDGSVVQSSARCADAAFEPNNVRDMATRLTSQGRLTGWQICYPGDVDHFDLHLRKGQRLRVDVLFAHIAGDLDAVLFGPQGQVIASSRGTTDNEFLDLPSAPEDGWYAFAVWGFNGATNRYDLDVTVE
jgi:hypothetical protein